MDQLNWFWLKVSGKNHSHQQRRIWKVRYKICPPRSGLKILELIVTVNTNIFKAIELFLNKKYLAGNLPSPFSSRFVENLSKKIQRDSLNKIAFENSFKHFKKQRSTSSSNEHDKIEILVKFKELKIKGKIRRAGRT